MSDLKLISEIVVKRLGDVQAAAKKNILDPATFVDPAVIEASIENCSLHQTSASDTNGNLLPRGVIPALMIAYTLEKHGLQIMRHVSITLPEADEMPSMELCDAVMVNLGFRQNCRDSDMTVEHGILHIYEPFELTFH